MSGLRGGVVVMPPKPRPSMLGLSPRRYALRSIPAQKVPPAPVSTPTRRSSAASSSSTAAARARAATPLDHYWLCHSCPPAEKGRPSRRDANDDLARRDPVEDALERGGDVIKLVH